MESKVFKKEGIGCVVYKMNYTKEELESMLESSKSENERASLLSIIEALKKNEFLFSCDIVSIGCTVKVTAKDFDDAFEKVKGIMKVNYNSL